MRRIVTVLALVMTVSLAACGGAASSTSPTAVVVSPSPSANPSSSAASRAASAGPGGSTASAPGSTAAGASVSPAGAAASAGVSALNPPVSIKMGVAGLAPEAGIYIALDRGYFSAEGLSVETSRLQGSDQIPLLATNKLQYGTLGPDPTLFNAVQRGVDLKIVVANATVTKDERSAALLVRQDLVQSGKYKSPADLKGMTIALNNPGASTQLYAERILKMGGLTRNDVKFTAVSFADMLTALSNKAIDAAWEVEPFVSSATAKGVATAVVPMWQAYPGAITELIVMSPTFAQEQPEAAKRFMVAFLRGQRDYYAAFVGNTNPAGRNDIITILTKYTAIKDPATYANLGMSGADPNGEFNDQVLSDMEDFFVAGGTLPAKVDVARMVDHSYAQTAVQQLGRI